MSFKKIIYLSIIFIVFLVCFSTVHASDFNESDNTDLLTIKADEKIIDGELLGDNNSGSFNDLAKEIKNVESGGTLNLTRDYVYSSGDSAVVIDKKIMINGNGYKIDASKSSQIFKCYGDEKIFNNIVFLNGRTYDGNGGAIYSESKLTLNNCVFKGNFVDEDYCGAAIYSTSDVILESCNFTNHYIVGGTDYPYLIYSDSMTVKNSRFFDNGAAAISYQSNLVAVNSQFLNNGGTALNSDSAKYTYIKNCTFVSDTTSFMSISAHSSAIDISSAFATYSDISLEDCKFINNSGSGSTVSLKFLNGVINNCEFINNLGNDGGGLYCGNSNLKIKNSRFESNRCRNVGGAINSFQTKMNIESCDFIDNSAINAGAIYWDWKDGSIISCNFINNSAESGGAIANWNLMNNNIEKSSFINSSDNNGNLILFSGYFTWSTSCYVSKISNNYFDSYDDIYGGEFSFKDNILTVQLFYYTDLNVTVTVDGKTFKKATENKVCSIDLSGISTGIYDAKIVYSNASGASLCEITMPLPIESLLIQVNEVNKIYGGPECLEINLKKYGVPIANANVDITVDGVTFTKMTDSNGHISVPVTLNGGVYDVEVTYQGVTKTSKITVNKLPSKTALDVYKTSKKSFYMNVTVEGANDGDIVVFKVLSLRTGKTDEHKVILHNSKADFHVYDVEGYFIINATYLGNALLQSSYKVKDMYLSFVDIPPLIEPRDIIKYWGGSEKLKIILKDDIYPVYNATVDIYIDGVKYTRCTDVNGCILMDIDLGVGFHKGYVYYDEMTPGFTITVKSTVYGEDVVADYGDVTYTATFLDLTGKPLMNGTATFKVNSTDYYATIYNGNAAIVVSENHGSYVVEVTNPVSGESITNKITILPVKTETKLLDVKNVNAGDSLTVTANVNSSVGYVQFNVYSTDASVEIVNNNASFTMDNLLFGTYLITATYVDPEGNYLSSSDSKYFRVFLMSPDISVVADDIGANQNAIFEITLASNATGQITLKINNKTYKNQLHDGKTIISVPDLTAGNYTYDIVYSGNKIYEPKITSGNISVFIINVVMNAQNLVKYYSSPEQLTAQLLDNSGNPLNGQKIIFTVNGKGYERTTNSSGIASLNINLNSGNYSAGVRFDGNGKYDSIKTVVQIEIKPTVMANDLSKIFRDGTPYYATFVDSKGNLLKNTVVELNINGVAYNRKTNENGTARLNINLNAGEYILIAKNPLTDEIHKNKITILPIKTETKLMGVKNVCVGDSFTVTASVNSSVGAVVFNIDSTNKTVDVVNNKASYTIDALNTGSYVIKATYVDSEGNYLSSSDSKSFDVSKKSPDISVVADDIGAGQNAIFEISLPGNATGQVSVKINNKVYINQLYNGKTIISVPNLDVGNYSYDIDYTGDNMYHSKEISGNISVFIINVVLNAQNLVKYYLSSTPLNVQLLDNSGNPLNGQKIIFTVNGKDYERTTNSSGIASLNINLNSGNYAAGVRFDGNGQYDSIKTVVQIEIKPTVMANDLSKIFRDDTPYYATFVDSQGNLLKNTVVELNINGVVYNRKTNENGTARLNINLNVGEYILIAKNPLTGEIHKNKITILPVKTETKLLGVKNVCVGDSFTVTASVNSSVGAVVFNIDSTSKTVGVVNNRASYTIDALNTGSYVIKATYVDSEGNYLSSSDSKSFSVSKKSPDISVVADDIGAGQNAIFEISLARNATGQVCVKINNKVYINQLYNGKTIISVPNLGIGNYSYDINYTGDNIYHSKEISGNISVFIINVVLNAQNLVKYYSSSTPLNVQLLDNSGNPLTGQKIIFTLNNRDYERTTNKSGIASININLNSGNYAAGVRFDGNGQYDSIKTVVQIEIKPTVMAKDFSKIFRNDTQYYATFVDSQGNPLNDTNVELNINGVFYNRKTNENGTVRLNINLGSGEYILTARNPSTGELYATKITVLPSVVENKDITKYYKNATQYTVKVLGADGKVVGAGETVKFNINGVFYERQTNESCIAKLTINLPPGDYVITAEYNGYKVSNNIVVLPVLSAEDITMKYRDGSKFVATLVDGHGKAYSNQTVQFNINGVMYNRATDSAGHAKLNINLMVGQYIITSSYNGASIANTITITD
jgi:ribosomal protein L30E